LTFHQLIISPFDQISIFQLAISSTLHFKLVIMSTCSYVSLPFPQLTISSIFHFMEPFKRKTNFPGPTSL